MKKILLLIFLLITSILCAEYVGKEEAIKMLQQAKAEDYPESNEIYISNGIVNLDEYCLGYKISESYKKILTEGAKKDNSVLFWYDTNYGEKEVLSIELIKKSGEIISFDPNEILQEKDNSFMGWSNIYSETSKILTAEIPNIEIGDIVYTKEKYIIKKAVMENNFFSAFNIEPWSRYLNDYLEINIPKSKKLFVHEINKKDFPYNFSREEKDGNIIYCWNTQNNPKIIYEPNMEMFNLLWTQIWANWLYFLLDSRVAYFYNHMLLLL